VGEQTSFGRWALFRSDLLQQFADVGAAPPHPGQLGGAEPGDELGAVRGLVRIPGVIEVEFDVADVGVGLVQHGRIDEFAQHDGPGQMRGVVDHGVGRGQAGQVDRVARRGAGDHR
jgi:hypothetical protein